jgi:AraC-like DNA-binding protein
MPPQDDLLAAVRRAITECMRDGDPNIARVAKKMTMNSRTLQRQMKRHSVRFKSFVDDIRRHFALNYLKDGKHTFTEIAFLLGYSEVSAFNRSFKRWTGQTPSVYRRRLSPDAAMPPPSALPGS